jgi:predicted glycoside hydrolase/deacetylase ChbG (UPF0249 family)
MVYTKYPFHEKLLIIHADDLGMCHSVNEAIFSAFEKRVISSASIMAPCQWFWQAAEIANQQRDLDIGVHLTFTSEWSSCRWRPVSCLDRKSGLVDQFGMLHRTARHVSAAGEVIVREVLAQFELCAQCGVIPTHLDSHMFFLFHESRVSSYIQAAAMLDTPYLLPKSLNGGSLNSDPCSSRIVDNLICAPHNLCAPSWEQFYIDRLNNLEPGITELLVHPGFDTPELRAMAGGAPYGAEWRQRDYDVLLSERFSETLERNRINVVSWRDICSAAG